MAADEHIRRTFDTLAERLRDEISRQLDELSAPLTASLDRERAAADIARERAERDVAAGAAEAGRLAAALADAESRLAAAVADADGRLATAAAEANDRLAAALAAADDRLTAAVADAKARHAEALSDADRCRAVALAEAEAHGRDAARSELRSMELAASERLTDAVRAMDRAHSLSEILDALVSCAGREAARVSVLLVRGSQLRAWRFIGFGSPLDETTQYEMSMADAGVVGEAVRTGAAVSGDSAYRAAHASAPAFAELPPGRETLAVPVPMSGQVVAVLYADQGPGDPEINAAPALLSWPASLEVMARHAARCLEAVTAYRAAQVLTDRPGVPTAEEEEAARRYARLLISEIKLYHEADVLAGRRERDLASRLGGEITRARSLYEQRVAAHIRQSTDYFHDELVRTLADGDGALIA
jgi:hypothetical protein